ncbi:MAG TPA: hypothetical protein PKC96_05045 [Bacilli bacterium]|nr:hypothetical protein [Bacilli bacterium]
MRDKLEKNGRKASYYRTRKVLTGLIFFVALGAGIGVPIQLAKNGSPAEAQTTSTEENSSSNVSSEITIEQL